MALIAGTLGADVINGTNADDTLLGYPEGTDASAETANDTISGSGGNDFEYGGGGNDQLNGGAGDDWLHGQNGSDLLVGDAGYDHLFGGDGNDVLHGGTPTSVLQDGAGNSLNGEGGNDALYSLLGAGVDTIDGGDGEDYAGIVRSSATVGLTFQMTSVSGVTTLIGDGTTVSNVEQIDITTGDGADLITTLAGADYIDAGGGNDILSAGAGDDIVSGGAGNDILNGGSGVDAMGGGTGDDTYVIDNVADSIEEEGPGGGSDLVQSSISFTLGSELENLTLTGAVAIDATGNSLNNVLTGNAATNVLRGSGGNDSASASAGNDTVFGGAGADIESGDSGRDTMFVILGANTLTFANDSHFDYVVGYKPGVDTFDLTSVWGLDNFADLSMQTVGNGVLVSYGFGGFFLRNTSIGSVEQGDFLLNDRPVAVHDVAAGEENQALTIDVLGNDIDTHGGHALTLNSVAAPPGQGSATIANNQLVFNPGSDFDHLAVGETTTVTLDYGIEDEHGAASASTVTVTVTGTNDAPIVSAEVGDSAGTAVPLVETDAGLSVSGTLTVTDPDLSDTVALTVHGVQVTGSAGSLTNAQLLGLFSIAPASLAADGDVTNNLAWSFDSGNEAFDFLAAGEQLTLSYTIRAVDDSLTGNNIGDGVVTIHIVGSNDGPVAVHDVAAGEENQTLTIDVLGNDTDADGGHALTLVSVGAPSGQGSATIVGNQLVFNPGSDFDHLAVGETAIVTLDYGIEDEHGASSASTVTVTVTGTNDAPIVSAEVGDSAGTAVPLVETDAGLSVSGTLTVTDPDLSDTVALTVHGVQVTGSAGSLTNAQLLGLFSIAPASLAADGDVTNNLAWSFDSGNEAFDFLAAGEQLTLSYTIRAVDDSLTGNNIGDGVVTIQIVGSTDTDPAPTVTFVQESPDPTAVTLVSTGTTITGHYTAHAITPDGHYAVFGNGSDIFVRDLQAGTTVSLPPSLAHGVPTSISADGRFVSFNTNQGLVGSDTNGLSDSYVYDTQTATVKVVSSDSAGNVGNGATTSAMLSADGHYAVFSSFASNLTPGDTNNKMDVFLKDTQTGEVWLLSATAAGVSANGQSSGASITPDGRYVIFSSDASDLVLGDPIGTTDTFRIDLQPNIEDRTIEIAAPTSAPGAASSISSDGRYLAFTSSAQLSGNDTNGKNDVYVKDMNTEEVVLVSSNADNVVSNNGAANPIISADGTSVAFASSSSNLVDSDTAANDVFVKSWQDGDILRASSDISGQEISSGVVGSSLGITANGSFVTFVTSGIDPDTFNDTYLTNVEMLADNIELLDLDEVSVDITPAVGGRDIVVDWGNGEVSSVQDSVAGDSYRFRTEYEAGLSTTATVEILDDGEVVASSAWSVITAAAQVASTLNGGAGADVLIGHDAGDHLTAGAGDDRLSGGGGIDILDGGAGVDLLTGGDGGDAYVFNGALDPTTNLDHVADFASEDTIDLENAIFTTFATTGTLAANAFFSAAGATTAHDADDRIVYNTTTGALFYDADGNQAGGVAAVQFAVLDNHAALSSADFVVV